MSDNANLPAPQGQFLIYIDGPSQLQVRLEGNTVWLTQKLIAELYGVTVPTINETGWKRFRGMAKRRSTAFSLSVPFEETKEITPHLAFFQRIAAMIRKGWRMTPGRRRAGQIARHRRDREAGHRQRRECGRSDRPFRSGRPGPRHGRTSSGRTF